ncbi:unnamed protein product, partial [Rangifer tarandus platyrhynchus]
KGSLRDRAPLPRRTGCLSEPRSESVGVTKEKGASTWEERSCTGRRARERAGGWGLGSWRRWRRARVAPRGGWTQPPISWVHRPPSRREVAPGGACGGRPARRRPGGPGGGGDQSGSEPPSLPFHLPSSVPGGPRAAGARDSVVLPPLWESRDLRAPAQEPPSSPHSYNPQPTPFPGPLFRPPGRAGW